MAAATAAPSLTSPKPTEPSLNQCRDQRPIRHPTAPITTARPVSRWPVMKSPAVARACRASSGSRTRSGSRRTSRSTAASQGQRHQHPQEVRAGGKEPEGERDDGCRGRDGDPPSRAGIGPCCLVGASVGQQVQSPPGGLADHHCGSACREGERE